MSTSEPLEFDHFYQFTDPIASRPLRLTVRGYDDWVTSDYAWDLYRGHTLPAQPIRFGGYAGGQITDFLWSDMVHLVCISSKVNELLLSHGVTGWSTYPVEVFNRKGEPLTGYYGFAMTGRECRRDRSRSQIITNQAVQGRKAFEVYKALYFHEGDWDGSDFFRVGSFGGTVVTQKVKNLINQAKVTNIKLVTLPEVELRVFLDEFDHGEIF